MLKKSLLTIVLALALLSPGSLAVAQPSETQDQTAAASTSVRGKWRGTLRHADGTPSEYRATVVVWRKDGRLVGRGWRSDGDCAARLTFRAWRSGWAHFRQTVTAGSCTPRIGQVKMQRRGERLLVRWSADTGARASMLARRIS